MLTLLRHQLGTWSQYILSKAPGGLSRCKKVVRTLPQILRANSVLQIDALVLHSWHRGNSLSQLRGFGLICPWFNLNWRLELLLLALKAYLISLNIKISLFSIQRWGSNSLSGILIQLRSDHSIFMILLLIALVLHVEVFTTGKSPVHWLLVPVLEPLHLLATCWLIIPVHITYMFIVVNLLWGVASVLFHTVRHLFSIVHLHRLVLVHLFLPWKDALLSRLQSDLGGFWSAQSISMWLSRASLHAVF